MKSIVLTDYNANIVRAIKNLSVQEMDIPIPGPDQVLIKVAAAPCNPSDIAFMRGSYNITRPAPIFMGFECSGTVVDTGQSSDAKKLLNRNVSALSLETGTGSWAEYCLTDRENCIILEHGIDMDQAAAISINPVTAFALVEIAGEKGCDTIIQNGASGQVGRFIRALAKIRGLNVINIVRRKEQVLLLKTSGEETVLSSSEPDFEKTLTELVSNRKALIAFDSAGGDMSGKILNAMPDSSELIIYGALSGRSLTGINTADIIFRDKNIKGFNLNKWKEISGPQHFRRVSMKVQQLIMDGTLKTLFQGNFALEEVQIAIEQYIRNMSEGKILLKP